MSKITYPVPSGYIVWRDNDGKCYCAKRPAVLIGPARSRTDILNRLYIRLQQQASKEGEAE